MKKEFETEQISKYKALALKSPQDICLAPKSFFNSLIRFSLIAAKVLQHGRQVIVKCQAQYYDLLSRPLKTHSNQTKL
jgi:hypothetical protein